MIKDSSDTVLNEEDYSYDAAGNVTDAPDSCFAYDTNNRLTVFNGSPVTYDLDGNMLSNGCASFVYDSANRLIKAGDHAYTYNAEDVRIRNLCGDVDTTYAYDTNCRLSRLLEKTTNGVVAKYVYGLGLIGEEKNGEFKTYHFDSRGSTVAITDINGVVTDAFTYDTYGNLVNRCGSSEVIFGYNGRDGVVTDKNGLIYMRARYYSPYMRRFVNSDIIHGEISDSTSLNRYSYVNGNPVSFVDPFGLSKERSSIDNRQRIKNVLDSVNIFLKKFIKSLFEAEPSRPSVLEAAYMAQHIYKASDKDKFIDLGDEFNGWRLSDIYINDEGLKMGVYYRYNNGVNSYSIVNAGSEMDFINKFSDAYNDWVKNNFTQPFGNSQDMKDSLAFAEDFVNSHNNRNITFIGHSKGGAEAAANAVATKKTQFYLILQLLT